MAGRLTGGKTDWKNSSAVIGNGEETDRWQDKLAEQQCCDREWRGD
jgi:hypothetical protein